MNHLDEGTIHAWLDGALDATQARDVEAHVTACATCSAAVAEARGLIAGASRILIALDDVPGGVIPKSAPAATGPVRARPRREWRAARWVTGIAAALMLAIGVTTWNRGAVKEQRTSALDAVQMRAGDSGVATAAAKVEAVPAPVSEPRLPSPAVAAPIAPGAGRRPQQSPAIAGARVAENTAAERRAKDEASREELQAKKLTQLSDVVVTAAPGGRAAAPPATVNNAAGAAAPLAAPAPAPFAARDLAEVSVLVGCYRTNAPEASAPVAVQVPAAETRVRRQTKASAAPATAPAREDAAAATAAPSLVRLDSTRQSSGYTLRAASTDRLLGSWEPLGRDSVRLDLGSGNIVTLSRAARVTCP